MRSDAKPATVPPFVNVGVTSIGWLAGEPRIPITGMYDGNVKGFAIQQDAVWGGNMEVLGKILSVPAYIRLQCGPHVVSIQLQQHLKIIVTGIVCFERCLLHLPSLYLLGASGQMLLH